MGGGGAGRGSLRSDWHPVIVLGEGAGDRWPGGSGHVEGGQAVEDTTVGEYLDIF